VDTGPTTLNLVGENGQVLATVAVPSIEAPIDLMPRTINVTIPLPAHGLSGCSLVLDPELKMKEITRVNNQVKLAVRSATGY
jgi:hypothetical protein